MSEGQKGGEFFTPTSIVKLIVEIIEPFHGRIFDPACGSGGMFVQSAHFVERHRENPADEISVFGQERIAETVRLCRMNLAVHGLSGDIRQANTYYEDLHSSVGRFDFVMANPPFNVNKVDKERIKDDPRFPFGLPKPDNANYLWIQLFYSALNDTGRAGFVMANSASDARGSEQLIRERLLREGAVDVMISIGPNFFYTVTLPCTLWFLDRGKNAGSRGDTVLFIDARHIFRQLDRAHRDFTPEQLEFLANIVRLYRGEEPETADGSAELLAAALPRRRLPRRARPLQGGDPGRDRSPGLEPQPRPLRGRGRAPGRWGGLPRAAPGAERGAGAAERRGARAGGADCGECEEVAGRTSMKAELAPSRPLPYTRFHCSPSSEPRLELAGIII